MVFGGGGSESAKIGRDESPAVRHAIELPPPHVRAQRECVDEDERPALAGFEVAHRPATHGRVVFLNHGGNHNLTEGLRPSDSPTGSLAGAPTPRSARQAHSLPLVRAV